MRLINPIVRRWLDDGRTDPEAFWDRAARHLPWFRPWDRTFVWNPPTFRWFEGGLTNLAWNALDHHVAEGRGGHAALVGLNERGQRRVFTYAQLLGQVEGVAASLRGLGVGKGDRITVYMPTCPEAILLMLAAVRIGAIHVVVFAGFGSGGSRRPGPGERLENGLHGGPTFRKGKDVPLKIIVDQALSAAPHAVERVVVLCRDGATPPMEPGRDVTWEEFLEQGRGHSGGYVPMESNEPAFILATSGTTAKPKLAVHTHGGYAVHIASMARWCFGLRPDDVWWSTSDIGWIVGHSYIVYAPLLAGCTTLVYEGASITPIPRRCGGSSRSFASPAFSRRPPRCACSCATARRRPIATSSPRSSVSSARVRCSTPRPGSGFRKRSFAEASRSSTTCGRPRPPVRCSATRTGSACCPLSPGRPPMALPGIDAAVVAMDGTPCGPGEKGIMVLGRPFPGLTPTLWGEPERYGRDYWENIPGVYCTGDSAHVDQDGYVWFAGRADELIKIAGHRLGTIEVETACLQHAAVAEAGVTGRPDELRGEVISAFVVLKQGHVPSDGLRQDLLETIRRELGPVAVIGELNFVKSLPKTRSGKIMRRVLKAVTLDMEPGDITTIEDEGSVEEAREAWRAIRAQVRAPAR